LNGLGLPVAELPIQVFPRPCEGPESFISRLAEANYLKPAYLIACLSEPPTERGTLSWTRLAAAAGQDRLELEEVLERTPPPSPVQLVCEYCGRAPRNSTPEPPPWWCSARCRRRSDLVNSAPSSRGIIPGQRETLSCIACGTRFVRSTTKRREHDTCSPRCRERARRTKQAELDLYENPLAVEDEAS
jgi:hypothetical protein